MFGLGRRKDDEVRRLQAREEELSLQLEQAQTTLLEATKRAETAESQAAFLASQNRALAAKVHRLALQRVELQNNHDRALRENKELQQSNLQLEGEARAAKAAKADAWQVVNLKAALRQQAAQHEHKMASLKRRTKALLTAILPGGHGQTDSALLRSPGDQAAPGSPAGSDGVPADLWDAPLCTPPPVACNQPDVHARVRQIVGMLYDDTLSEEQALEQMTSLTRDLTAAAQSLTSDLGCSPFPMQRLAAEEAAPAAAEKVDAATDMLTYRAHCVADVATETPAEMSYMGTPRDIAATPSGAPASPSRSVAGGVPALDLAALVAQAMEDAPLSGRSTASTSAGGSSSSSFNAFSQFVLANPEKLQRLIMRHAAATGKVSASRPAQSPYGGGLLPGASGVAGHTTGTQALDPTTMPLSMGTAGGRPSLASRLLGLGGGAAGNRNNAPVSAAPLASDNSTATSGVLTPSSAGNTLSPAKAGKRPGPTPAPKLVKLDGGPVAAPSRAETAPALTFLPGAKILSGIENSSTGGDTSVSGRGIGGAAVGVGKLGQGKGQVDSLESDLATLQLGGSSALAAFRGR